MELEVAIQTWLDRIPDFELDDSAAVTWSTGRAGPSPSYPALNGPSLI
ncbi:MAG: hypothetical protein M5T61_20810 [Acidimicrobiia bacterium]|nr:hypothetical protein [Acidimicrobiia bacterium]